MSSEKQVAANQLNSIKSTGPKSAAGRHRASLNARKHGLRSRRKAALAASGYAQEERRRKWLAQYDAQTDYDEFMISSSASLACDVERSRRVCAADVEIMSEDADADDAERADELGDQLFFDPAGPTALYGIDPVPPDTTSAPSRNRKATDPNKPSRIVRRLEKTSAGCEFLLREWKRLRALAETGFWLAPDRFRAARMLGRQPVDAAGTPGSGHDLRGQPGHHPTGQERIRRPPRRHGRARAGPIYAESEGEVQRPVSRLDRSRVQKDADRSRR